MQNDEWIAELRRKRKSDREKKINKEKERAKFIGKANFNLEELKKYWSYRYEDKISPEELAEDMRLIEENYYLAGEKYKTMKEYGEFLMMMELYR